MPKKKPRISKNRHYKNKSGGYTTTFEPKTKKRLKPKIFYSINDLVRVMGSTYDEDVYRITDVVEIGKIYTVKDLRTSMYYEIPSDELSPYPIQIDEEYEVADEGNKIYRVESVEWNGSRRELVISMDSGIDSIFPSMKEFLAQDENFKYISNG